MGGDIREALKKLNDRVLGRDGVTGTAVGAKGGSPCLKVYVRDSKAASGVPSKVDGFSVVTEVAGVFRRL